MVDIRKIAILLLFTAQATCATTLLSSLDCYKQGCSNVVIGGDTYVFTAWGPTGNTSYQGTAIPGTVYGTFNDGESVGCSGPNAGGNINIVKLKSLDLANPANTIISGVNCMGSYGYGGGSGYWPPGPNWQCSAAYNNGCSWKSGGIVSVNGVLYWQILRQEGGPYYYGHDSTMIMSADGGATWLNPAHVGGTPDPLGDAPMSPGDSSYAAGMLWPEPVHEAAYYNGADQPIDRLSFIQYCQDESINCPNVDDNATYVYALSLSGNFAYYYLTRIRKTDLPRLRASDWDYYYCPGYSESHICDGTLPTSWTKTIADITPIQTAGGPGMSGAMGCVGQAVYLKDLKQYLFIGSAATFWDVVPSTAPHPWGPWTPGPPISTIAHENGFPGPMLFTAKSDTPGHVQIVMVSDATDNPPNTHSGTIFFDLLDVSGNSPPMPISSPENINVYPNPWRKSKNASQNITFSGISSGSTIKIFSITGQLIKELKVLESDVSWNPASDSANGIYVYSIADIQGNKTEGQVAVIR